MADPNHPEDFSHVYVHRRRDGAARPDPGPERAVRRRRNPEKVNLGVGVYYDDNGKLPLLEVRARGRAEHGRSAQARGYLPIDGIAAYDSAVQGPGLRRRQRGGHGRRVATVQALGGTGGLKVGADFLQAAQPGRQVLISDPSWENHRALFTQRRFHGRDLSVLRRRQRAASTSTACSPRSRLRRAGTIVVLHACCHNPTGYDLTADSGTRWSPPSRRALSRSWTWPTRASATASPKTAR